MRYSRINPDLFRRNRQKLIEQLDKDSVAVVHSHDQMVRTGDQYYPFRQNPDLFYLTGIEQEMSVLLVCPGRKEKMEQAMLFLRKPDPALETWEGKKLSKQEAEEISGIASIYWLDEFPSVSRKVILSCSNIFCNLPEDEKFKPEYPRRDERMMVQLQKDYPAHEFRRLAPVMAALRPIKEPEELDLIRQAIEITRAGFERLLPFIRPGLLEYEVEAELSHVFIRRGAEGHAYPPIIASGPNACALHYIRNDQVCRSGDLLLMDFGAEYANYAADCTRTVPVNGRFSKRQRELYDACLRVFRGAKSLIKPGITINRINKEVAGLWETEHVKLGLYSKAELKKQDSKDPLYRKYFPHGTAHFLGLDVHDAGSKETKLKPGMVLTCEPGIYIPEEGIGIRLENDLLIEEDGNTDLMDKFPIEAEEIETIMSKDG